MIKIILKSINMERDLFSERNKKAYEYGKKLEKAGWFENIIEGCYISPERSTCFEYNRSPYYGQLDCYDKEKEEQYNKICQELILKGDFILIERNR